MFQRVRCSNIRKSTMMTEQQQQQQQENPPPCSAVIHHDHEDTMSTVSSVDDDSTVEDEVTTNTTTTTPCSARTTIPRGFLCPLTMQVMYDPVLDAEGNTYERAAILEWLHQHRTSPISRQPLSERMLNPNNSLRDAIHEFMGEAWVRSRAAATAENGKPHNYHSCPGRRPSLYRDRINCFLQFASSMELQGLPSQLNEQGCCAFRHDGITMALDVPESVGVFCLYTRSLVPQLTEPMKDLLLELNFLQADTRGGCLSVKRNAAGQPEVMFSYMDRVSEINAREFVNVICNFTETAVRIRNKLCQANDQHNHNHYDGSGGPEGRW